MPQQKCFKLHLPLLPYLVKSSHNCDISMHQFLYSVEMKGLVVIRFEKSLVCWCDLPQEDTWTRPKLGITLLKLPPFFKKLFVMIAK